MPMVIPKDDGDSDGAPPSDAPALPHGYPPTVGLPTHGPSAVHLPGIIHECKKALADHCAAKGIDVALLPLDIGRMKNTHGSDVHILIQRDVIETDSDVGPPVVHACAAAGASLVATKLTNIIKSL
eukprot:gene15861-18442_t